MSIRGTGTPRIRLEPRGMDLLHDPMLNKGLAHTEQEREALGLRGLLPPAVQDQDVQIERVLENLSRKSSDLERYIMLVGLQDRNEALFYRVLMDNLDALMPIVYTPTVGEACQLYGHIFRRPRGLFVSANDRGRIEEVLHNWPHEDVRMVVVTDGERILGLGDLGAAGMGIPVGKLVLYTACGGVDPTQCLPVTLDVGTENEALLADPLYIGLYQRRIRGNDYDAIIEEFVQAVRKVFPRAVIQLEDFANRNAFRLLRDYRESACLFDDDIQGTGSVALAGIYSALRLTGGVLRDHRFLFLGAGEAGIGIACLIVSAMEHEGAPESEAKQRCWFVDSRGLVTKDRTDLAEHKQAFAHDAPKCDGLSDILDQIQPTAVVGVSGVKGLIDQDILVKMAAISERPIILAMSNPTSKAECTAEEAYTHTQGRAIFASGSPFAPVEVNGKRFVPGQANNAYVFPGVGLGLIACGANRANDEMFFAAARALANEVSESDLALGRIYPPLKDIRRVSLRIAEAVAEVAYEAGYATVGRPADMTQYIESLMYSPRYETYV